MQVSYGQSSHPSSLQSLQAELKSLCVSSSPPSLHASPIKHPIKSPSPNLAQSPPTISSIQPNMLHMISEESIGNSSGQVYCTGIQNSPSITGQQNISTISSPGSRTSTTVNYSSSLPSSPLPFLGLTFTPPQSFRCSPVDTTCDQTFSNPINHPMFISNCLPSSSPKNIGYPTPSISVTDESGFSAHFPIIPPPHDFAHHSPTDPQATDLYHLSDPNIDISEMESNDSSRQITERSVFPKLHRWKDGNDVRHHSSVVI